MEDLQWFDPVTGEFYPLEPAVGGLVAGLVLFAMLIAAIGAGL